MFEHECLNIVFDIIILTLLFWHYYYFDIMTGVVAGGGRCFETRIADPAEPRSAARHERTGEPPQVILFSVFLILKDFCRCLD